MQVIMEFIFGSNPQTERKKLIPISVRIEKEDTPAIKSAKWWERWADLERRVAVGDEEERYRRIRGEEKRWVPRGGVES